MYIFLYIIFIPFLFFEILNKNRIKFFYYIFVILLFLIAGLRAYNIGGDTNSYFQTYMVTPTILQHRNGIQLPNKAMEKGFLYILMLLKSLNFNFTLILLLISFIVLGSVSALIKNKSKYYIISIYFYYVFHYQLVSLNMIRQSIIIAMILFCLRKKITYKKMIFIVFIGYFIHSTVLIFPILYYLSTKNYKIWTYYIVLYISILGSKFHIFLNLFYKILFPFRSISFIQKILEHGYNIYNYSNGYYLKKIILMTGYIFIYKHLKNKNSENIFIFKLFFWTNIFQLLLSFNGVLSFRISYIGVILNIILIPYFLDFFKSLKYKIIITLIFIVWGGNIMLKTYYKNGIPIKEYSPYKIYLQNKLKEKEYGK